MPPAELYTLSLHDALPISGDRAGERRAARYPAPHDVRAGALPRDHPSLAGVRSEEHTSELQSRVDLVCRLLLEKKKASARRGEWGADLRRGCCRCRALAAR